MRCAILLLMLLFSACGNTSATIVEQKIGPYDVSFDLTNSSVFLNSSASFWNDSDPVSSYGIVSIVEKAHPNVEKAVIWIHYSKYGLVYYGSGEASRLKESGWDDAQTYTRVIDSDPNGILTVAENRKLNFTYYSAGYQLDKDTIVRIDSWLPMNDGTGDLLNTIHVAVTSNDRALTDKTFGQLKDDLISRENTND